ncbi:MAG: hypothetical protein DCF32_01285 [Leptolyngbya sp.]|nr:MAG: hypothetical protein DCF32_01285 [Leptolyngbya sp.]
MLIHDLSRQAEVPASTIRYYELIDLLDAPRRSQSQNPLLIAEPCRSDQTCPISLAFHFWVSNLEPTVVPSASARLKASNRLCDGNEV